MKILPAGKGINMGQREKSSGNKVKVYAALLVGAAVGKMLVTKSGWHPPELVSTNLKHLNYDLESNRLVYAMLLWVIFSLYWTIASRNSAETSHSESSLSTGFHQLLLGGAMLLLFIPAPRLTGWFLPQSFHFLVAAGAIVQAGFLLLAVWARRHLGRNWSAEVRIGIGHQLVRSGPYKFLRHPIYTAMLGMFVGTAIASSQYHALLGVAILVLAYLRKSHLEDRILAQTFSKEYDDYRRDSWALVPFVF
jgi:protein-S-isoprenylcysteine O-methyltransferase Ste14